MKAAQTPRRRTSRLVALARWSGYSPRSSLLGQLAHEAQLRTFGYRGSAAGVYGEVPPLRYASTGRKRARRARRRAYIARLRNVTLRSSTVLGRRADRAGITLATEISTTRTAPQTIEHPEWGTIKLSPYVTAEQRERAPRREKQRAASRAARRNPIRSLEIDIEKASMMERLQRMLRPDAHGSKGIRSMLRRGV